MSRCKVNDKVMIIKAIIPENIGKFATITASSHLTEDGEQYWQCLAPEKIQTARIDEPRSRMYSAEFYSPDSWLMPIAGPSVNQDDLVENEDEVAV